MWCRRWRSGVSWLSRRGETRASFRMLPLEQPEDFSLRRGADEGHIGNVVSFAIVVAASPAAKDRWLTSRKPRERG
jgi:hypothetical protein